MAKKMVLTRALLSQLNRTAHALCRRDYAAIRAEIMADLERMKRGGATDAELAALLESRARQAPARASDDP